MGGARVPLHLQPLQDVAALSPPLCVCSSPACSSPPHGPEVPDTEQVAAVGSSAHVPVGGEDQLLGPPRFMTPELNVLHLLSTSLCRELCVSLGSRLCFGLEVSAIIQGNLCMIEIKGHMFACSKSRASCHMDTSGLVQVHDMLYLST